MAENQRKSIFPRTTSNYLPPAPKRALTEQESEQRPKRAGKLLRQIPVSTDGLSFATKLTTSLHVEAVDPWERYQKVFKMDQAGSGILVHSKDDSFREAVAREVKVHSKDWLLKLSTASHANIVILREALYDDGAITFFYEVMDVSLAQVFATPLGRLKPYEVAAFCSELLAGIDYIHDTLKLVHGDLNAETVLLTTDGVVKIGNLHPDPVETRLTAYSKYWYRHAETDRSWKGAGRCSVDRPYHNCVSGTKQLPAKQADIGRGVGSRPGKVPKFD
jgi:serine/threonine protein kinase